MILEMDIMLSKNNKLVVIHAHTLESTTNGTGRVSEKTSDELLKLDAGSYFSGDFKGEKIPLFEDVLKEYGEHSRLEVELKTNLADPHTEQLVAEFVRLVEKYQLEKSIIACSFNPLILQLVKQANPHILRAQIYSQLEDAHIPWYQKFILKNLLLNRWADPDILQVDHAMISQGYMDKMHDYGYVIHVWTVNDPKEMRRMMALGVDGIITDRPFLLRQIQQL